MTREARHGGQPSPENTRWRDESARVASEVRDHLAWLDQGLQWTRPDPDRVDPDPGHAEEDT